MAARWRRRARSPGLPAWRSGLAQQAQRPPESREQIMATLKQLGELKSAGILTDAELSLLRTRLTMNRFALLDPELALKLLTTAEYYRDFTQQAAPWFPEQVQI